MKVQKALPAHFPKLKGQAAALYPQIVRKLLPGKGDIEFIAPQPLGLGREVGHQLGPGAALAHVGELFTEAQIFFCKLAQQVPDDPAVVSAGGGTHVQDARHVQKHHADRLPQTGQRRLCRKAHRDHCPQRHQERDRRAYGGPLLRRPGASGKNGPAKQREVHPLAGRDHFDRW